MNIKLFFKSGETAEYEGEVRVLTCGVIEISRMEEIKGKSIYGIAGIKKKITTAFNFSCLNESKMYELVE